MESRDAESRMFGLVERLAARLTPDDVESITSLVTHNESGIGLENLCTQLYEHQCTISQDEFSEISTLAEILRVSRKNWAFVKELAR